MKNKNNYTYRKNILSEYVEAKMELVRLELILDNFFMSVIKDRDWEEKQRIAQNLYNETKDILEFLTHEFYKGNNKKDAV